MPFQSEKQRRFLHANHPEIAKRWEKEYSHGGILDIDASEEIISDDGNDIELTDYNAAFDDPNDLSTGVKSLFQAKDGGRIGFFTGMREQEQKEAQQQQQGPPGGGDKGMSYTAPSAKEAYIAGTSPEAIAERNRRDIKNIIATGEGEKYDTEEQMLQDKYAFNIPGATKKHTYITGKTGAALKRAEDALKAKLKKTGKSRLFRAILMVALGFPINSIPSTLIGKGDIKTVLQYSIPIMKAKKAHKTALQNAKADYEELGMAKFHHAADTPLQDIEQQLLDLTQTKDDDTGDDKGGPIYAPLTGAVDEEYAQGYYNDGMSDLDKIRAGQAKRAMLVQRGIIQDNPIVDESITDITMQANSGGLANLFRVKKQ